MSIKIKTSKKEEKVFMLEKCYIVHKLQLTAHA